jgi:hypothetical protein
LGEKLGDALDRQPVDLFAFNRSAAKPSPMSIPVRG